jgi:peptidoglycan hydrolase CwlO-like protein
MDNGTLARKINWLKLILAILLLLSLVPIYNTFKIKNVVNTNQDVLTNYAALITINQKMIEANQDTIKTIDKKYSDLEILLSRLEAKVEEVYFKLESLQ